jgi:LuxR family maltose regulon positive regulatory protein
LVAPVAPALHLSRPQVCAEILDGNYRAVLVVASKGSGTTSLLADCYALAAGQQEGSEQVGQSNWPGIFGEAYAPRAAWLALSKADNGFCRLWSHLVVALQESIGTNQLPLPQKPSSKKQIAKYFADLSNSLYELSQKTHRYYLFIDNIGQVSAQALEQIVLFVKSYLPANFCFVLGGSKYPVGLDWFRLLDAVKDLNPAMMALSQSEVAEYLKLYGLADVSDQQINELLVLTDGWITGIKFSVEYAISQEESPANLRLDSKRFNQLHELFFQKWVLADFSNATKSFLLETSFLDKFNSELCDYVTGSNNSLAILESISADNSFVSYGNPCEHGKGNWYVMQPLFKQVLQNATQSLNPGYVRELNFKASEWYEHNGYKAEAAKHLLLSIDIDMVLRLVKATALNVDKFQLDFQTWIIKKPAREAYTCKTFSMSLAWTYLICGRPKEARGWFAVSNLATKKANRTTAYNMAMECFVIKCSQLEGNYEQAIIDVNDFYAKHGDDIDPLIHCTMQLILAESYELLGQLENAANQYIHCEAIASYANAIFVQYSSRYLYGSIQLQFGNSKQVKEMCQVALTTCPQDSPMFGALCSLLSSVQIENNELEEAEKSIQRAFKRLSKTRNLEFYLQACIVKTRILFCYDKFEDAYEEAVRVQLLATNEIMPHGAFLRILLAVGRVSLVINKVKECEQVISKLNSMVQERDVVHYLPLLLLRAQLMEKNKDINGAIALAAKVSKRAGENQMVLLNIRSLLMEAHLYNLKGQKGKAAKHLSDALFLGARQNNYAEFISSRAQIRGLVLEALQQRKSSAVTRKYAKKLLELFDQRDALKRHEGVEVSDIDFVELEVLTGREKEILRVLASGMSRQEIAEAMSISLNTVKTHLANIFTKLGVSNKAEVITMLNNLRQL